MLDQIMKTAAEASHRQFEVLDRVTQNVANINTTGYKIKRFEQYLRGDGQVDGVERKDYSQGSLLVTRRELDIAVDGNGFIPVTQPDGTVAYTRDGSLAKNSKGFLVTKFGDLVGDGIQLPPNYEQLMIERDGTVKVLISGQQDPKTLGQISLVAFQNPEGLQYIGGNKLVPTDASGEALLMTEGQTLKQGTLERANVNVFYQIDQILRLNAGVLSNMRIVRFTDEVFRQAVNLRQ